MRRITHSLCCCLLLTCLVLPVSAQNVTKILRGGIEEDRRIPAALNPFGVWSTEDGRTYVADTSTQRILVIDPDGQARTVAGTGRYGPALDGVPATETPLANPTAVAVDRTGSIYIADAHNHAVHKVTPYGQLIRYAGTGRRGKGAPTGQARHVDLDTPTGVFVDAARNLYIADSENDRVLRVGVDGNVTRVVETFTQGSGSGSHLSRPSSIWVDATGDVYVADRGNHRVLKVDHLGGATVVAGTGRPGYSGDGRAATRASLQGPWAVAVDRDNNVLIADTGNRALRRIDTSGRITTIPLPDSEEGVRVRPYGLFPERDGALTIADTEAHTVLRLLAPETEIIIADAPESVPADGRTRREIVVEGVHGTLAGRFRSGSGQVVSTAGGIGILATTPGPAMLELRAPGAWPVAVSMDFTATRHIAGGWDRTSVIANGDDTVRLAWQTDRSIGEEEAYRLEIEAPDGTVSSASTTDGAYLFSTGMAGRYRVAVSAPGAFPFVTTIEPVPAKAWEQRDLFEPNDGPEGAVTLETSTRGTLHTSSDEDWYRVPAVPGHRTRIDVVSSQGQVVLSYGGDDGTNIIIGPPDEGQEADGNRIRVWSPDRDTADYTLRFFHERIATFAPGDAARVRADGLATEVPFLLLNHHGEVDFADDSTRVQVSVVSGQVTLRLPESRVRDGRFLVLLSAQGAGEFALGLVADGIPVQTVRFEAWTGAGIDGDPAEGNQSVRNLTRQTGETFEVDLYVDPQSHPVRGVHYRVDYDATVLELVGVVPPKALAEAQTIPGDRAGTVTVSTVLLEGATDLVQGWIGRLVFKGVEPVVSTSVRLSEVSVGYDDGRIEEVAVPPNTQIEISLESPVSLSRLAEVFGSAEGDQQYDRRYDVDGDGVITYLDFLAVASRL